MKHSSRIARRRFLKGAAVAAAVGVFPDIVPASALGLNGKVSPSNRLTLGLIGQGLMMRGHRNNMIKNDSAQVLAVCDVDRGRRENARAEVEKAYGEAMASGVYRGCDAYNEYENVVARPDIDAVFVVTPDHWHVPISIAAIRNGKDVYTEKPLTLTIKEGRLLVDVARRHGAVLQTGSMQRSDRAFRKAAEIVRSGWIGKVHTIYARLGQFAPPATLPAQPIPEGFDYDRWLGPTPWYPYNLERVKGNYGGGWRRFWDYGARKNGDWGAHHFDIIQWALGMDHSGPVEFYPKGWEGLEYQTHVYADGCKVLRDHPTRNGQMIQFIGTEGEVCVSRGGRIESTPAELAAQPLSASDTHLYVSGNHHQNWMDCIASRRKPICDVEIGHRSATICHLSAIAERLRRPVKWDPEKEEIVGDATASRWLDRPRRAPYHL